MADYTFTVDGVDICDEYGASLIDFAEELPQPKIIKVAIPAGADLDITDAFGSVGYSNGRHDISLLVQGADEVERMERVRGLIAYLHGQMMDYALSWDAGYSYTGRFLVKVERVVDYASRVIVSIDRKPFKSKYETVEFDAALVNPYILQGSTRYQDLRITLAQAATVSLDGGEAQSFEAGTHLLAADLLGYSHDIAVTLADWVMRLDEENENVIINTDSHPITITNGNLTVADAPYTITNGNLVFAKQIVTLRYYRWDV